MLSAAVLASCGHKAEISGSVAGAPDSEIIVKQLDVNVYSVLDTIKGLLSVDKNLWKEEVTGIKEFYAKFGDRLPKELENQLATLEANLK